MENHQRISKVKAASKFIPFESIWKFGSQQFSTIPTKSRENGHNFAYQNRHLANPIFLMFQRWILSRISQQRPHQFSRTGHIMSMAIFNGSRLSTMAVHDDLNVEQMKPVELFTCNTKWWWMIKTFVESFKETMLPTQRGQIWRQKALNYHDSSRSQLPEPVPDLTSDMKTT